MVSFQRACFSLFAFLCVSTPLPLHADPQPVLWQTTQEGTTVVQTVTVQLDHPDVVGVTGTPQHLRGVVTSDFAKETGSLVAINGDFYDRTMRPLGLTVSNARHWESTADTPRWSFLACTADKQCHIDVSGKARMLESSWETVLGGRDVILNGAFTWGAAEDAACGRLCTEPHPRTVVGLSADGKKLYLVVIEGRRPGVVGVRLSVAAAKLRALGADTGLHLDGGYSSELVWDGKVVSGRPTRMPGERPVANHLGVVVRDLKEQQ